MLMRILNAVLIVAFVALLCGYVCMVFADKPKAHVVVVLPRGCIKRIEVLDTTECIVGDHSLHCEPVAVVHLDNCAITRVVK